VIVPENERLNWLELVPPNVIPVIEMADEPTPPVWVSVSDKVFEPLLMLPKANGLGEMLIVASGVYVPVTLMALDGDVLAALLVTVSVAVLEPEDVGVKVTFTVVD
jgi:hypothetical protein